MPTFERGGGVSGGLCLFPDMHSLDDIFFNLCFSVILNKYSLRLFLDMSLRITYHYLLIPNS